MGESRGIGATVRILGEDLGIPEGRVDGVDDQVTDVAENILKSARTIAVVGLSPDPRRPSHGVARYLQRAGYRIIPVNPNVDEVLGERAYPSLRQIPQAVDVVEVFRRSEFVGPIVDDAIAIKARAVWLQDGVVDEDAAARARASGLDVVMDDCMMRRHAQRRQH
jgi:predicted CoA-binding protein